MVTYSTKDIAKLLIETKGGFVIATSTEKGTEFTQYHKIMDLKVKLLEEKYRQNLKNDLIEIKKDVIVYKLCIDSYPKYEYKIVEIYVKKEKIKKIFSKLKDALNKFSDDICDDEEYSVEDLALECRFDEFRKLARKYLTNIAKVKKKN